MVKIAENPMGIDFGNILKLAERRRVNLEGIGALLAHQSVPVVKSLQDAKQTLEMLSLHWEALDPEGREMLPENVRRMMQGLHGWIINLESMSDFDSGRFNLALMRDYAIESDAPEAPAKVGITVDPEMTPLMVPMDAYYKSQSRSAPGVEIKFEPNWNALNFPNGIWVAIDKGKTGEYGSLVGTGGTPTAAYLDWENRNS